MGPLASCRWDLKMMQLRWKSVEIPYERKYPVNVVVTMSSVHSPVALLGMSPAQMDIYMNIYMLREICTCCSEQLHSQWTSTGEAQVSFRG